MALTYHEMDGYPQESVDLQNGFRAVRMVKCTWSDRIAVATELAFSVYPYDVSIGARCLELPTIVPFGKQLDGGGSLASYNHAIITANYTWPCTSGPDSEDLVTEEIQPSSEFITLPPKDQDDLPNFFWPAVGNAAAKPVQDDECPGYLLRGHDYIATFHRAQRIPLQCLTLAGYVNQDTIVNWTLSDRGNLVHYQPETLLFLGATPMRKLTTDGISTWTITYRFSFRNWTWNKFFCAATKNFEHIRYKNSTIPYKPYPVAPFSQLWPR